MAMSPMWLSCNHWSISPNPMASLRFVSVGWDVCVWLVRAGGSRECMAMDELSCDGCVMGSSGMGK